MILLTSQEREENERLMKIEIDLILHSLENLSPNKNWNVFISDFQGNYVADFYLKNGISVNVFEYISTEIPLENILDELIIYPLNSRFSIDASIKNRFDTPISTTKYLIFYCNAN